jgi:hypothetical protein
VWIETWIKIAIAVIVLIPAVGFASQTNYEGTDETLLVAYTDVRPPGELDSSHPSQSETNSHTRYSDQSNSWLIAIILLIVNRRLKRVHVAG